MAQPEGGGRHGLLLLLVVIAGLASLAISGFGLQSAAWGGALSERGFVASLVQVLFWLPATLSLPFFLCTFRFPITGLFCAWATPVCMWFAISWNSWQDVLIGRSTTTNPMVIVFGSLFGLGPFGMLLLVPPVCMQIWMGRNKPTDT